MSEAQHKKEFIESLKRLIAFFKAIDPKGGEGYCPTQEVLDKVNFIGHDLSNQYSLTGYKKSARTEEQKMQLKREESESKSQLRDKDEKVI